MSKRFRGKNNPFYNKKHSNETRKKLSKINIGKKMPLEIRNKISGSKSKKFFYAMDLDGTIVGKFKNIAECGRILNTSDSGIGNILKIKIDEDKKYRNRTANGMIFVYLTELKRIGKKKVLEFFNARNMTSTKYSNEVVKMIRKDYSSGNFTQKNLAEKYGMSAPNVNIIVNNKGRLK
jgi:hypothetical protein